MAGLAGLFAAAPAYAGWFGDRPRKLPEDRSIYKLNGEVWINGGRATPESRIGPGDSLRTGAGAELIAVVGKDALILRENSELQLDLGRSTRQALRLLSGAMLSVFGKREIDRLELHTPVATIGIRGTGVYTETDAQRSYICTCYGETQIAGGGMTETIHSSHHDAARYVYADAGPGRRIESAPFKNHTDLELMLIEALVGREVPFPVSESDYERLRRDY